jgi:hypothetical protein
LQQRVYVVMMDDGAGDAMKDFEFGRESCITIHRFS